MRVGAQEAAGLQTSLSEFGPARVQVQLLDKGQGRDVGCVILAATTPGFGLLGLF